MVGHLCCHGAIEDFRVIEETTGTVCTHNHLRQGNTGSPAPLEPEAGSPAES